MKPYEPDYRRLADAARNIECPQVPLYEHIISTSVMETILGKKFGFLRDGDAADKRAYFRIYAEFLKDHGYDAVPFECSVRAIFPGGGALGGHVEGAIRTRQDYDRYPWEKLPETYFRAFSPYFEALRGSLPPGMKAVGGVGNGVFECVQDLTGYMDLCYMRDDDPDLYVDLFRTVGGVITAIWTRFLRERSAFFSSETISSLK